MPIYIKIDGIEGDATAKGFEKQIEAETFSLGFSDKNGGSMPQSRKSQDVSGIAVDIAQIVKWPDPSTSDFLDKLLEGDVLDKILVTLTKREKNKNKKVREVELTNVKIASVHTDMAEGGSRDIIAIAFSDIKWTMYGPQAKETVVKRSGKNLAEIV